MILAFEAFLYFLYLRLNYTEICEENKALREAVSVLKDQNTNFSTQESELYEHIQSLEKSLADAEMQAKTYYEKVSLEIELTFPSILVPCLSRRLSHKLFNQLKALFLKHILREGHFEFNVGCPMAHDGNCLW